MDPEVAGYLVEMRDNGELRPAVGKRDSAAASGSAPVVGNKHRRIGDHREPG